MLYPPPARFSFPTFLLKSQRKTLPLPSTATPVGKLKPLPRVVIAQKCAVCAAAEGANPLSAPRHRTANASTRFPQRTRLFPRRRLSGRRPPEPAIRLSLEICWEVALDGKHKGPEGDENGIDLKISRGETHTTNE